MEDEPSRIYKIPESLGLILETAFHRLTAGPTWHISLQSFIPTSTGRLK